jgi:hypothetical protein
MINIKGYQGTSRVKRHHGSALSTWSKESDWALSPWGPLGLGAARAAAISLAREELEKTDVDADGRVVMEVSGAGLLSARASIRGITAVTMSDDPSVSWI